MYYLDIFLPFFFQSYFPLFVKSIQIVLCDKLRLFWNMFITLNLSTLYKFSYQGVWVGIEYLWISNLDKTNENNS